MRYCTGCGKPLQDDQMFCTGCGKPVGQTPAPEPVSAPAGHTAWRAYKTIYNPDGSVYSTEDLGGSTYQNH